MRKTVEQQEWIIKNKDFYKNYNQLTDEFNKKFGTNIKMSSIYNFLRCKGLIEIQNESYKLTYCEMDFLKSKVKDMPFSQLTNEFNKKFNKKYSRRRIERICFNNGFYRNGKDLPVGSETKICNGKYTMVKVKSVGDRNERWQLKHRKIYEDNFGEIPKDKVVFFLDGNTQNFDISNLYLTEKRIVYLLRNNKWFTKDAQLNLTMIKWCELYYALKKECEPIE